MTCCAAMFLLYNNPGASPARLPSRLDMPGAFACQPSAHPASAHRTLWQVEWLKARVERIPVRFCFESSLELMEVTQVGGFKMAPGGKSKGPPPAVKKVRWGRVG